MKKYILTLGLLITPAIAFAATAQSVLVIFKQILDLLIPIAITLAVVYFFFGLAKYMVAKDETGQAEARNVMIYGIIGLFVMISIWGLVGVIANTFGLAGTTTITLPTVR